MKTINNVLKKLNEILSAYKELKLKVYGQDALKEALDCILMELFSGQLELESSGMISCDYIIDNSIIADLPQWFLNDYVKGNSMKIPLDFNIGKSFSLVIRTDDLSRTSAEHLLQTILFELANKNEKGDVQFKCLDYKKSGFSYGGLISLINENKYFGKKLYKADSGLADIVKDIENQITHNISQLRGDTSSVFDYNRNNEKKIPITIAAFCDCEESRSRETIYRLKEIVNSSVATGISTIFLVSSNSNISDLPMADNSIVLEYINNNSYISIGNYRLNVNIKESVLSSACIEVIEEKLNKVESVNTSFEQFYNLSQFNYFSMDSSRKLSIPFAFDENKKVINLEIGGEAPAHALISGSTGSGKSVLLHTIIEQILLNYHPNDVEIWAIDYKAVEFGCYVSKKTPHITVIGQDNSEDFSLSLIDLVKKEYDRRKELFLNANVSNFNAFRRKFGQHSISRILIVIDEFHNLTQAINNYVGEKQYKTILENLLREMRAMGMSFFFCSQTIAAGLNGLTDAARNQIGCRISMKHEDLSEIRQTLSLSINTEVNLENIKNLRKGQAMYKQVSTDPNNPLPYELKQVNVMFITDQRREEIIDGVNAELNGNYNHREEIICKNSNRYPVVEKPRHPISKFVNTGRFASTENVVLYPGAPTTLNDSYSFGFEEEAGNNLLIVGDNDNLRESIIVHTILGLLMDKSNRIVVSILDTDNEDNIRLYSQLQKIRSNRILLNYGLNDFKTCLGNLTKIRPTQGYRVIYFWYGLNKLKNLLFLDSQDEEEDIVIKNNAEVDESCLLELVNLVDDIRSSSGMTETNNAKIESNNFTFENCKNILKNLAEYGPENSRFNVAIYNTLKSLKKTGLVSLEDYEYRIGCQMSTDDSYDMFGSSNFMNKADEKTVVLFDGSKNGKTIRPYLMPDDEFYDMYNSKMEEF